MERHLFHGVEFFLFAVVLLAAGCQGPSTAENSSTNKYQAPTPPAQGVNVQWFGQSCFLLTDPAGHRLLLDPVGTSTGYRPPRAPADVVLMSHAHGDHANLGMALEPEVVIQSLEYAPSGETTAALKKNGVEDLTIQLVTHTGDHGSGETGVMTFKFGGLVFTHVGDTGRDASATVQVPPTDVMFVPVGGYYTINAEEAKELVTRLAPKVVIPMHYQTAGLNRDLASKLAPVNDFQDLHDLYETIPGSDRVLPPDIADETGPYRVLVFQMWAQGNQ